MISHSRDAGAGGAEDEAMRSLGSSAIIAGVALAVAGAIAVPVLLAGDDDSRPVAPAGALALGELPTGGAPRSPPISRSRSR